jgi:adenine-specific DNA-methyltransferase
MPAGIDNRQRAFLEIPQEVWRPIHYLGSKLRLTDSILDHLDDLSAGPVCDLFAGSGTVSLALSRSRDVLAADIQEYSRVICTALLTPTAIVDQDVASLLHRAERSQRSLEGYLEPLLEFEQQAIDRSNSQPELLCDLVDHSSLISGEATGSLGKALKATKNRLENAGVSLLATRYFGGRYFSFRQAIFIDSILNEGPMETYLAALLSTTSTIVNSIGKQFAQPMRPRRGDGTIKAHLIRQMCRDRSLDASKVFSGWLLRYRSITQTGAHRVMRGDYRDVLAEQKSVGVIYADPPYTRDHYSRFYHVLETLCLRDCPDVSTTFLAGPTSRGLYRTDRHQSPFCIKSQAPKAFADLFAAAKGLPMLLSYSPFVKNGHPRMMTVEAVVELAKKCYRQVKVVSARLVHSKLNKTNLHRDALEQAEVFILCR